MRAPLLIALVLCSTLTACRGGESDKPPVHFIPNMDTQEKGKAYRRDTTGLFADGRMMRAPVEGTVAIGHLDEDDTLHEGLGTDGGTTQKFPVSIAFDDAAVKEHGKLRYDIYCATCHGVLGDGKGPTALKGGLMVPPPSFHDPRLKGLLVGKIYAAIKNGVNNGNMPSYAAQIPVEDRWKIIAYVRQLQGVPPESGEGAVVVPAATVASAEHGALLYKAKGCVACHTLDGTRTVGPTWKGAFGRKEALASGGEVTVDDAYLKESILKPMEKVVAGYPPAMPTLPLTDIEVDSLILFIKAQQ
ncbi:MAG: quinol:cytochrome c oxidoreductase monoheme cytochrome subunit [Myxococcaceae bacterium]|nr:quinol:cytochrome c oxidoreductase monoheme cytochrome subunit [Myxococcaceae bacterium]